jgi:acyl-coenzyme A thioesterase PaaI-like protein
VRRLPGGGRLFGWLVGRLAPYSGTIAPTIVSLEPGHAVARMPDRHRLRNHLGSLHAIALVNLGELTTGLALMTALPPGVRGIPTALSIEYVKKARGAITAECRCAVAEVAADVDREVEGELKDRTGDVVARVTARWHLSRRAP